PRCGCAHPRSRHERVVHMSDAVADAVVAAALEVPSQHLCAGALAVADISMWTPKAQATLIDASPAAHYRQHAKRIAEAWSANPSLPGAAVALSMRASAGAVDAARAEQSVSLVWTGPSTDAVGLRSTRAVLYTLVANATASLLLVSFATYDVADLAAVL